MTIEIDDKVYAGLVENLTYYKQAKSIAAKKNNECNRTMYKILDLVVDNMEAILIDGVGK